MRFQAVRVLHFGDVLLIWRQANRNQRECCCLVLDFQRLLIHPHRDLRTCQSVLPVQFPMVEPDVAVFIDLAGKLGRVQGPRKNLFGNGAPARKRDSLDSLGCRRTASG